jgi:sugar lactone lactonase YvrE
MKKLLVLASLCSLFACSKPGDPDPGTDPGNQGTPLTITTVSPETGNGSTLTITINGTGFNATPANNQVKLGALTANVSTASTTQLVIGVPLTITEGFYDVIVKANNKTATKAGGFFYSATQPVITSVSPERGSSSTTTVTITGAGFNPVPANNQVTFGTQGATVNTASPTELVVALPANMAVGTYDVRVQANGKIALKIAGFHYNDWAVSNFAGTGASGTADGTANQATFMTPIGITADADGNLFVADQHRIRKITPNGNVTTYAGSGIRGTADGNANIARFNFPTSIAADVAGNLYVADQSNHLIRKISTNGTVSTIAGTGNAGKADGIGVNASFNMPYGVAVDPQGTVLYVGDNANHLIRKINLATNEVTSIAGNGTANSTNGNGLNAGVPWPGGLHLTANGNLYVTERGAGRIRKITPAGEVSTIGGTLSTLTIPTHLTVDDNENVYAVFKGMNLVKKYTAAGVESTIFGNPNSGDVTGPAHLASFSLPEGITLIKGTGGKLQFYICDGGNRKIKKISMD